MVHDDDEAPRRHNKIVYPAARPVAVALPDRRVIVDAVDRFADLGGWGPNRIQLWIWRTRRRHVPLAAVAWIMAEMI